MLCVNQRFSIPVLAHNPPPHTLHISYVTLITSDVCSIQLYLRSGHHRIFRHDSSSKRTYSIQSAYKCARNELKLYISEVYDVTLVCAWRRCANHEWFFRSEVNYNGFPLLREYGAMDTVYREHVNRNTVQARSAFLTSWLSESGVLTKRDMQNGGGGGWLRTGIENRWCKSCHTQVKYAEGNTTNLRNHIRRFHPVLLTLSVPSIYFVYLF